MKSFKNMPHQFVPLTSSWYLGRHIAMGLTFFMKQFKIESKKHGNHFVLIDDEDYDRIKSFNWFIVRMRNSFYAIRNNWVNGKNKAILMHRFLLDIKSGSIGDHKNGNTLDNTKENLRLCTNTENIVNSGMRKNNTSGFKGVHFVNERRRKKFLAKIRANGRNVYLGHFKYAIDAAIAYNNAAVRLHGEFANLNKI